MASKSVPKFAIALEDVSDGKGPRHTGVSVALDFEGTLPDSDVLNTILPDTERRYKIMLDCIERKKQKRACVDRFLRDTSKTVMVGKGLIESLSVDLKMDIKEIFNMLIGSNYVNKLISYIGSEYWKNKKNPVEYAEAYHQLVDLFGVKVTFLLLKSNGIGLKNPDVIYDFYKFSSMHPKVKQLVNEGAFSYSTALLFSSASPKKQLEIAKKVKGMSHNKVKDLLGIKGSVMSEREKKRIGT